MVKTERQRLEEQAARAVEIQHSLSRPPSFAKRAWAKLKKFKKHATKSSKDRIPEEDDWSEWRKKAANFVFSKAFEAFMGVVILVNIILIIVETDQRIHCVDPESPECPANALAITLPDRICLGLYILELGLKIFSFQKKFLKRPWGPWNIFDTCIVVLSILGEVFGSFFKDAVIIRVIRVTRLVRMLRLLTLFQELYLLMAGMATTIRTLVWATIMLMAVLSIQALVAVEVLRPVAKDLQQQGAFQECTRCNRAFDSVVASMITFFQTLLIGEGVNELIVPMIEENWIAGLFLIISTIFVYLGISNLILTVIVEKAKEAKQSDSFYTSLVNNKMKKDAKKVLIDFWKEADVNSDETLSLTELRRAYNEQEHFRSYFISHDMDLDFLQYAFKQGLKGADEEETEVSFEALAEAVVDMKNSDMCPVMSLIKFQVATIIEQVNALHHQIMKLTGDVNAHMAINERGYNSQMEHGRNVINAINAINPYMCRTSDQQNDVSGGTSFLGSDWWSKLSGHQPVNGKQAKPRHYNSEHSDSVHASIDVGQEHHTSEDPNHQLEEGQSQEDQSAEGQSEDCWPDDPIQQSDDPQPQESDEPGYSPRSGRLDLAEVLKSAYGNPLPLDLPNLDAVQRNFAKLCERVEESLDSLDRHWIDDANRSRAHSKKEVYAAGARLLGRLGKSMTGMLNESGEPPPKVKLRREKLADNPYFGNDVSADLPIPSPVTSSIHAARNADDNPTQNDVARSRTSANDDAYKAMQRSGTRSAAMDHQGHKGRRVDQDVRAQNDATRSRISADATLSRTAADKGRQFTKRKEPRTM